MIELPIIDAQGADEEKPKQRFWRSPGHLRGDPAFRELARHEFMPGAADPPGGTSRRQFMQLLGASLAMAGLTACRRPVENILPYTRKPEEIIPGIPLLYATSMPFRGTVRGVLVESHEGRPTKIEGNPDHPGDRGGSGLFEQASLLNLYDPDRSRSVLRDGTEATWQDFVQFCQGFSGNAAARRVAVVSAETSSPTEGAMRAQLQQVFPQLRWITYRAEGDDPVQLGLQQAFGQPLRPHYHFADAQVIVSLDADFLSGTARNFIQDTRAFADSRRLASPEDTMSRLYVVESAYTLTGGMADNRLRLRSSEIAAFAAALAAQVGVAGVAAAGAAFASHPYVAEIARDMQAAGANAVVLAGETQPPEVHALCAAINSTLGSIGTTVSLLDTGAPPVTPQDEALNTLIQDMDAGSLDAVLILGCNPVYDAPAGLDFATALRRVSETIHLGLHVDETAQVCRWHIPATHYLEAWGDGRSYEGTLSIIQPLIAPLYADAHSVIEVLNTFASGLDQAGYDLVRRQWQGVIQGNFEQGWRRALHDGFLPGPAYPSVAAAANPVALGAVPAVEEEEMEVVFRLDAKVFDGQYANNVWCQELPDPITKVVWDNVVTMSPATASRLGLTAEYDTGRYYVDLVTLTLGGQSVELPVWIVPGHADNSLGVTLGYGRTLQTERPERSSPFWDRDEDTDVYAHGALANGIGQNVAPLRATTSTRIMRGAEVSVSGGPYTIVTTQDHGTLDVEARPLIRLATYEEFRQNPAYVDDMEEPTPGEPFADYPELWDGRHPSEQDALKDSDYYKNQWGMVIDLNSCTGCNACVVACNSENNIPMIGKEQVGRGREMHWMRLDRYWVSDGEEDANALQDPQMVFQPMLCQHCENAPCESVCPVAATVHSPDGLNTMVYNRCIGTRYCANNCPYKVRRFNYFNWTKTLPVEVQMAQNPDVTVRFRGVMEKCTFCVQRIRGAQRRSNLERRSIRDGEVVTACQQACPAQAITFGDMNDPNSAVEQQRRNPRSYEVLAELNIKPRVSYLGRVLNPNPRLTSSGT